MSWMVPVVWGSQAAAVTAKLHLASARAQKKKIKILLFTASISIPLYSRVVKRISCIDQHLLFLTPAGLWYNRFPMAVNFFDLTRQNKKVWPELMSALEKVAVSGRYILGENVSSLEKELAALCGVKHAIGVASGTDALHLALRAAGVGP